MLHSIFSSNLAISLFSCSGFGFDAFAAECFRKSAEYGIRNWHDQAADSW